MLDLDLGTEAAALSVDDINYKIEEAALYLNHGLYDEAEAILKKLLDVAGDNLTPELQQRIDAKLQEIAASKGLEGEKSRKDQAEEIDEDKLRQDFENCLGLIEAGFLSEALEELKILERSGYNKGIVRAKIGELYLKLDMPFDAIDYFEMALEDPDLPENIRQDTLYQLALTYERTGSVTRAVSTLEQLVKLNENFRNAKEKLDSLNKTAQKFGRFYYLIRNGLLNEDQLEQAKELARQSKKPIESILINQFGIDKDEIGNSLSEYYRCPFIEFNELEVGATPKCISGVKEHFFRTTPCAPIKEEGGTLLVAVDNPHDLSKIDNIQRVLKARNFEYAVALKDDIDKFIDYFFGKYNLGDDENDVFEQLELVEEDDDELEEDDSLASDADSVVVQMANKIIEDAYIRNASDIHIESLTGKRGALIRYRIDGDCLKYQTIPFNYKKALVSRIKIMANLDIAEKRLPQDGKIKFKTRTGKTIELRVATLPTTEGNEDVVLRILASSEAMPLDRIGLLEENLKNLKKCIEMPYGLILVVGPTGSGKTTTLHAALGHINRPEKKIWTAEDPVEIVQDGLRQVQVKPSIGLTFARILRAFLRADPDVIMVGETRDEETANTVIEASLTGHLVFSTLHTNSAPETVTRLLGMGMDPFNFADALLCVLAQRLVKRLCPKCKEPYTPDSEEKERILYEYGKNPARPLTPEDLDNVTLYRPKGCHACNNVGYKGRMAIHELLVSDDGLRKLIQSKKPVMEIRDYGLTNGMTTLKQDGIRKVLMGETDMRQVLAACIR
ncbi:MAG: Flp pilus assembly complex ATPase component [Thermodesulfobacteria bacterium]|nr:Flp pilus assembly complex ATPase component [Thermodesulfobacteriota bacterium]